MILNQDEFAVIFGNQGTAPLNISSPKLTFTPLSGNTVKAIFEFEFEASAIGSETGSELGAEFERAYIFKFGKNTFAGNDKMTMYYKSMTEAGLLMDIGVHGWKGNYGFASIEALEKYGLQITAVEVTAQGE